MKYGLLSKLKFVLLPVKTLTKQEYIRHIIKSYTSAKCSFQQCLPPFLIPPIMRQVEKGASIHPGLSHIPPVTGTLRKSIASAQSSVALFATGQN